MRAVVRALDVGGLPLCRRSGFETSSSSGELRAGRLVALLSELLGLLPCPAQEKPPKMLGGGGAGKSGAIN